MQGNARQWNKGHKIHCNDSSCRDVVYDDVIYSNSFQLHFHVRQRQNVVHRVIMRCKWLFSLCPHAQLPNEHLLMCTGGSKWKCAWQALEALNECQFPGFVQKKLHLPQSRAIIWSLELSKASRCLDIIGKIGDRNMTEICHMKAPCTTPNRVLW